MERCGDVAAIVCDTTENTVTQGSCDRVLAMGWALASSLFVLLSGPIFIVGKMFSGINL